MKKKTMVIGLGPEYHYPGKLSEWSKNNTLYAANFGASLISDSILRQFNADYVEAIDNISDLRSKYDTCVLALATHLHPSRDVSHYTKAVEKLQMKTIVLSIGISDYTPSIEDSYDLHPSVRRLLEVASETSEWIGVRGHYSAGLLRRKGFSNVLPIGCPTAYRGMRDDLKVQKKENFKNVVVPYHLSLAKDCPEFVGKHTLLGQDFQDEAVFTENLVDDSSLIDWLKTQFESSKSFEYMRECVRTNGVFRPSFEEWFAYIGQHDFVVGPRLHGCLAGLIQGIPTVMTPRDLRGTEIAEFFEIPTCSYEDLRTRSLADIYADADFSDFNDLYPKRYADYVAFLNANGLEHQLAAPLSYHCAHRPGDLAAALAVAGRSRQRHEVRISKLETSPGLLVAGGLGDRFRRSGLARWASRTLKI
jgi:hypothetical protein